MKVVQLHGTALFNKIVKYIVTNCKYTLIVSHVGSFSHYCIEVKHLFARGNSHLLGLHSNIGIRLEDILLIYYDDNLNGHKATSRAFFRHRE